MTITIICGKCNHTFNELSNIPAESRRPCPSCGSTARLSRVTIEDSVLMHSELRYKAKQSGKGKPFIEGLIGDSLSQKFRRWMHLDRIIDRRNDLYKEVVTDPKTDEEIHRSEEPLSQHIGHGDDNKNKLNNHE